MEKIMLIGEWILAKIKKILFYAGWYRTYMLINTYMYDLTESQCLEGGCRERGGGDFLMECFSFYIKNKGKSEIFKDKKSL